ncbi:MAG TPA: Gfo/Idh/MocA family oxidoreductase, partial [Chthoniobacterales bacterium]
DRFSVAGLAGRDPAKTAAIARRFGITAHASVEELVRIGKPQFVVTSVPWAANPSLLRRLAEMGMPALSETPPAGSIPEMEELCELARQGAKIQVAEQYFLQPHHAARLAFIRGGKLGPVHQAQVSAAHGYHGVSLIRRFLGVGFENATIQAMICRSKMVEGPGRSGLPAEERMAEAEQVIATLDFGGKVGVYDFTGRQYFALIRDPRVLIRGERGEILNQSAVYLRDFRTPIRADFVRHSAGQQGDLAGHYLAGIQAGEEWVYRNPFAPARLFDDEIAIATCLEKMGQFAAGGEAFYPLAEACQDRYLDLMIAEAAAQGRRITTTTQAWAASNESHS